MLRNLNTSASYKIGRREQSLSSLLFFFAKLLHAKPKEASHEKRERKPVSSSRLCSNNVVVCNCAGWNKNYTDFKRKGGLRVVYEIGSLPDFGHRLETREGASTGSQLVQHGGKMVCLDPRGENWEGRETVRKKPKFTKINRGTVKIKEENISWS